MKDLIERQAAIEVILTDKIDNKSLKIIDALGSGNEAKTLNMACDRHAKLLKSLPSAQSEIITCEHCKHGVHTGRGDTYLCVVSPENTMEHKYDFWCAYAERRNDE